MAAMGELVIKWDPESLKAINALAVQLEKLRQERDADAR